MADVKSLVRTQIEHGLKHYLDDLAAMDDAALGRSPGGSARCGFDFTYEVIVVNERIAARLKGEDPGPWPFGDGWAVAPDGFRSKEAASAGVESSTRAVLAALETLTNEDLEKPLVEGQEGTRLSAASMCGIHLMYHDAQLNYLQSMAGDGDVHWKA